MLCRLAIWNYHIQTLVKDNAEFDVTGMLNMYPQRVREGNPCLHRTLIGYFSNICVDVTLFVNQRRLW